jgi:hypothetical protein
MAGPTYCYRRLWNIGRKNIYGDTSNVLNYLERRTYHEAANHPYLEFHWFGATQAGEEMGGAPDSDKDGTTTPFQITVVSADANDTDASTGDARKVAIFGVTVASIADYSKWLGDSSHKPGKPTQTCEVINLNGTTDVLSSRWYLWCNGAFVCDWGSGGDDAKGDITIESPADTDLYTIKATTNESNGCRWHFVAGDLVTLDFMSIQTDATLAAGDGVVVKATESGFENELYTAPDMPDSYFTYIHYGNTNPNNMKHLWITPKLATKTAKLTMIETLVANSKNMQIRIGIRIH